MKRNKNNAMTYITFQATDTAQVDYLLALAKKKNLSYEISDYTDNFAMYNKEREKLVKDFFQFAENNSIAEPNFTFNREECYVR